MSRRAGAPPRRPRAARQLAAGAERRGSEPDRSRGSKRSRYRSMVIGAATVMLLGLYAGLRVATRDGAGPPRETAGNQELPRIEDTDGLDPRLRQTLEAALERAEREGSAAAAGELGRLYNAHHFHEQARRCYERARALDPVEPEWPYHLALLAVERGEVDEALELLRRVLELRADYLPARARLGDLLLAANRLEEAQSVFAAMAHSAPEGPWDELGLGKIELRLGAPARAIEHLERARRLVPGHAETRYLLATAYRDLGQDERAAELLRGIEQGARPERPPDPLLRRVLEQRQDLQSTIAEANALLAAGRVNEAEALYQNVLAWDPQHYDASYDLGVLYGRAGRYDDARAALEVAVASRPASAEARVALAMSYAALGRLEEARREATRARELAPDDPRPRKLLDGLHAEETGI